MDVVLTQEEGQVTTMPHWLQILNKGIALKEKAEFGNKHIY